MYRRALTPEEQSRVEQYLLYKWSIGARNQTFPEDATNTTVTTDAYNTVLVQRKFNQRTSQGTAFIKRSFTVPITSDMVLSLSAKLTRVSRCA